MALGVVTHSADGNHWIIMGGTFGDTSVNGAGSHGQIYHIDVTPMVTNGTNGQPLISVLSSTLPTPTEGAVGGLTQNGNELILFSGARYWNSELPYPIAYSPQLLEVQQSGFEDPFLVAGGTSCSSSSSLSGGQIAGIVVGSILGTALIVGLLMYFALRGFPSGKSSTSYLSHGDSSSSNEMSSRA